MLSEQYPDSMGQLTALTSGATDNISGEQVVYAYDALNRLASAAATGGSWGQSYAYDGFGNLTTQTVTAGTAPSLNVSYNWWNNRQNWEKLGTARVILNRVRSRGDGDEMSHFSRTKLRRGNSF
jgi:YD repeat-containing protein